MTSHYYVVKVQQNPKFGGKSICLPNLVPLYVAVPLLYKLSPKKTAVFRCQLLLTRNTVKRHRSKFIFGLQTVRKWV